jgi:hypothetical protein
MFGLTLDQLGFAVSGFLLVLVVALSWSISKRNAFERGYGEGKHDRQHWEDDQIVRGKLERNG